MQIKINGLLVVLMAGIFLLLGGCNTPNTNQGNATSGNNQNALNQNVSTAMTPPMVCTGGVNEQTLKAEINTLPAQLKNQFKEINPGSGTISLSYPNSVLTFKGFITGNGNNLSHLINGFDKFRSTQCVKVVSFEGETAGTGFEWRADSGIPTVPGNCKRDVEDAINNSRLASQINKNLYFSYDEASRVLTFSGYVGDGPGNGQFNSLFARLQSFMGNGCISKIVFAGRTITPQPTPTSGSKTMLNGAFGWTLCQDPLCECSGECVSTCPCPTANTNTNTNTSVTNTNTNTNTR